MRFISRSRIGLTKWTLPSLAATSKPLTEKRQKRLVPKELLPTVIKDPTSYEAA